MSIEQLEPILLQNMMFAKEKEKNVVSKCGENLGRILTMLESCGIILGQILKGYA